MRVLWTAVVYMCVVSHWYITIHDRDVSKKEHLHNMIFCLQKEPVGIEL